jgi:hypothetical protein
MVIASSSNLPTTSAPRPQRHRRSSSPAVPRVGMLIVAAVALVVAAGCGRPVDGLLTALDASRISADGQMFWMSGEHQQPVLTEGEARRLAGNPLGVALRHLRSLEPGAALILAACPGSLSFDTLETITPDAAAALGRHRGPLQMDALSSLTPAAAAGLASHAGTLSLDGVRVIDPATAGFLARHRGLLALNGLSVLDAATARALAEHDGPVCLNGLGAIDKETAAVLASAGPLVTFHTPAGSLPCGAETATR